MLVVNYNVFCIFKNSDSDLINLVLNSYSDWFYLQSAFVLRAMLLNGHNSSTGSFGVLIKVLNMSITTRAFMSSICFIKCGPVLFELQFHFVVGNIMKVGGHHYSTFTCTHEQSR